MSAPELFAAVLTTWLVIGIILAFAMGRRGHAPFTWLVLGALLGPFGVILAVDAVRRERTVAMPQGTGRAGAGRGGLAVLAGIDGSPESLAALDAACRLLGPRIGRLTLAGVVSYDAAEERTLVSERETAARAVAEAAARARAFDPETVVLAGRPDEALARHAAEGGYDLLVVGRRGRGRSKALMGSVATRLAAHTPVPVLMGGPVPVRAAAAPGSGAGDQRSGP